MELESKSKKQIIVKACLNSSPPPKWITFMTVLKVGRRILLKLLECKFGWVSEILFQLLEFLGPGALIVFLNEPKNIKNTWLVPCLCLFKLDYIHKWQTWNLISLENKWLPSTKLSKKIRYFLPWKWFYQHSLGSVKDREADGPLNSQVSFLSPGLSIPPILSMVQLERKWFSDAVPRSESLSSPPPFPLFPSLPLPSRPFLSFLSVSHSLLPSLTTLFPSLWLVDIKMSRPVKNFYKVFIWAKLPGSKVSNALKNNSLPFLLCIWNQGKELGKIIWR